MSKGEIVDNKGEGHYSIKLKFAVEVVQTEISTLQADLERLDTDIMEADQELTEKRGEADQLEQQINGLIPDLRTDLEGTLPKITELQRKLADAAAFIANLQYARDTRVADRLAKAKRLAGLQSIPKEEALEAWCADYTEDLTGDVGLIDINDEGGKGVIIQPGHDGLAEYLPIRDGALMPRAAQSGAQIYFNAAILPGMQKWFPRYRVGEITKINQDLCDVRLDEAKSSAQNLDINREQDLTEVPIYYMDCDGDVFEEGDRVVVRFTQSGPLVIGFEKEPRACYFPGVAFQPARLTFDPEFWPYSGSTRTYYGEPYLTEEGSEINYPLGTEGQISSWVATPGSGQFRVHRGRDNNYGPVNWIGEDGGVLSWDGPPGRVWEGPDGDGIEWFRYGLKFPWVPGPNIYYKGKSLDHGIGTGNITGAAFWRDGSGQEWLRAFEENTLYQVRVDKARNPIGEPELVADFSTPDSFHRITGWYFSETGDKAVCTFVEYYDNPKWPSDSSNATLQRRIVARFDGQSFTQEQVYDQGDIIGQNEQRFWQTMSITEQVPDTPSQDYIDFAEGEDGDYNAAAYIIPIYYDFVGNTEISVRLEIGALVRTSSYERSGYWDGYTDEESNSESYTLEFTGAADRIVTSQGETIVSFPAQSRTVTESGSRSSDGPTTTLFASAQESNYSIGYRLLALDGRFNCCAVFFTEQDDQFTGSGVPFWKNISDNYVAGSGSFSYRESFKLYAAGQELQSVEVYDDSGSWAERYLRIQTLGLEGRWSDGETITTTELEKQNLETEQRYIVDFVGYSGQGVEFYSATMLPPGSSIKDGRRLFYKTGGGNMIDQALALGDDVYLLNPGLR